MALAVDHVVIAVRDLEQAAADFAAAGFTVSPGGWHVGGETHNSLVSFADGSYFELLAFAEPDREQTHKWWGRFAHGEGTVDFALLSPDLDTLAGLLRTAGIEAVGPVSGGRKRPDGVELAWRTLITAGDVPLPFVIEDVTAHDLRVPPAPATDHPNGALGVAGLTVLVPDLETAVATYAVLLGIPGEASEPSIAGVSRAHRFFLGTAWIELAQPDAIAAGLRQRIDQRGAAPYEIVLRSTIPGLTPIPLDLAHGAHIHFAPED